jgi:hypothetical protein
MSFPRKRESRFLADFSIVAFRSLDSRIRGNDSLSVLQSLHTPGTRPHYFFLNINDTGTPA